MVARVPELRAVDGVADAFAGDEEVQPLRVGQPQRDGAENLGGQAAETHVLLAFLCLCALNTQYTLSMTYYTIRYHNRI